MPDAVDTVVCALDDGWRYHPKHVELFPEIRKLCNVAYCWIYIRIPELLVHIHFKFFKQVSLDPRGEKIGTCRNEAGGGWGGYKWAFNLF